MSSITIGLLIIGAFLWAAIVAYMAAKIARGGLR